MKRINLIAILCLAIFAAGVPAHGTTYATWIMVWHGSDQGWWRADMTPQVQVGDDWKALDWVGQAQVEAHLDGIKNAGVSVVIADLTNGWKWLDGRCMLIQSLCAKKGLKFCVGENSDGNVARFEGHAQDIWNNFAGPLAANHDTYFQYRGKLYHLGGNHYRLIVLESGLALEAKGGAVIQNWDSTDKTQKWTLSGTESGCYKLVNDSNGEALTLKADFPASLQAAGNEEDQQLVLQEVLTV